MIELIKEIEREREKKKERKEVIVQNYNRRQHSQHVD